MNAANPKATFPIVLEADLVEPADHRPIFSCHFLTGDEFEQIDALTDQAQAEPDKRKRKPLLVQAIGLALVGWANVRNRKGEIAPFEPEKISSLISMDALWELPVQIMRQSRMQEEERKKSGRSSGGSPDREKSAGTGATASV